jgi:hypothetical protein
MKGDGAGLGALIGGVLVLVAMLVIGTLTAKMVFSPGSRSGSTTSAPAASTTTYVDHGPPIDPSASKGPPPPLAFNDADNAARFEKAKGSVADLQTAVDAIPTGGDAAATNAQKKCGDLDPELAKLGGEPHPTVRELVEKAHRLCEYDRPLKVLQTQLATIEAARKKNPKQTPLDLCKKAQVTAAEITAGHYQDDPAMQDAITTLGKDCI